MRPERGPAAVPDVPDPMGELLRRGGVEVAPPGWRSGALALGLAVGAATAFAAGVAAAVLVLAPIIGPAATFTTVWLAFATGHGGAPH